MNRITLLLLVVAFGTAHAAGPLQVVTTQPVCQQHITSEPQVTAEDWPKRARGRDVSAYVVMSYRLDGSGKARDATVIESKPDGLFDKTAISLLNRTRFANDVVEASCVYVRTFGSVMRG